MKNTENLEKAVVTVTVESAIAELEKALNDAHALHDATNASLRAVCGALLGGIGAFHKDARMLTAYVEKALKAVKKDSVVRKYARRVIDFVEHESGIVADDYGYKMCDTKKLATAQENVKSVSILDYESEETQKAKKESADKKALEKAAHTDMSAKERVCAMLIAKCSEAKARAEKELKRPEGKRNIREADKASEESKLIEQLIEFLNK